MLTLRRLIRAHRAFAVFIAVLALSVKLVVPQGYMVGETGTKILTVQMCFDGLAHEAVQLVIPMNGKSSGGGQHDQGKSVDHCSFASLSMGSMAGADAPLLALLLLFILALGYAPVHRAPPSPLKQIRPPLRGPPAST